MDEVKLKQAIAKEVRKMVEATPRPPRKPIDEQLDGTGKPGQEVLDTRQGQCEQHGQFVDQLITIVGWHAYKKLQIPYWVGCPKCRELWEEGNKSEEQRRYWGI